MTRVVKSLLFASLLSAFSGTAAHAQTIHAATCNSSDVQAALNSVSVDGSTVIIPAGTCTWTTAVSYNQVFSTTILGAGNQSTVGGGDATVILDHINHNNGGKPDYTIAISTAAGKSFRFSGVTLEQDGSSVTSNNGNFLLSGSSQAFRVDHCHFLKNNQLQVGVGGQVYGVFDHDLFDSSDLGIRMSAYNWGGGTNGDGSWADATTFGSNRFIFVENSTFNSLSTGTPTPANDCITAGRFVFRFNNLINGAALQTHPTGHDGSTGNDRGCRAWEIYENTFTNTGATPEFNAMFASAGTGLMWGNAILSGYENGMTLHSMRRDNSTYAQTSTPNGWGYCGSSFNGTKSNWDQNTNPSMGYACLDQPGRGVGDLLGGTMPQRCDVTAGDCSNHMYTGRWPNEALEPIYQWSDHWNPVSGYPGSLINNDSAAVLIQNQDYYTYTTSFNGTSGTGSGTLAARPSNCTAGPGGDTPGVAYWATDQGNWNQSGSGGQGVLYVCTATNTWTLYYTPFAYPHPLTLGSTSSSGPPAPSNLIAVINN